MSIKSILPFGPQHPVLPEPLQVRLVLEDEKVVEALPSIGYIHRGLEKIVEIKDFQQAMYVAERICGICSFMHSQNYCQGIEALMNITVPDRARYLRVIWAELHRIHSHLLYLGLVADAFGFENLFMQYWRAREHILDVMEKTTGNRVLLGVCTIGGVKRDISPEHLSEIKRTLDTVKKELETITPSMVNDYSVKKRMVGVGVLPKAKAHEFGAVGPVARASGIEMDFRTQGYAAYNEVGFRPVTDTAGDCYARTMIRVKEIDVCDEMIRKACDKLPSGPLLAPVKGNPDGETVARIEQPRGELLFYFKANGTKNLDRFKVRTPTFANLPPLLHMLQGCQLADVPVIIISIDPCISCCER